MEATFSVSPPQLSSFWPLGLVVVGALLPAVLMLYLAWSTYHAQVVVDPARIHIRGVLYGRSIPVDGIDPGSAKIVDLGQETTLQPVARVNGIGLPGYRAGWFRLRNGERALLFVSRPDRVVYVPTRLGFSVLVSVEEPEQLLSRLRKVSPGGRART